MYIGSAVYFKKRWHEHKKSLNKGTHHSIPLQRALHKLGKDILNMVSIFQKTINRRLVGLIKNRFLGIKE